MFGEITNSMLVIEDYALEGEHTDDDGFMGVVDGFT